MGAKLSLLVAIGGGKGGVGKSLVASNLAIAMARLGLRVILVDADLGAANLHTMFAIDHPKYNLQALVRGQVRSLEEVVVATGIPRLFLVPGSGGEDGAGSIKHAQKLKLIRHIHSLEADAVVVDCGAGVSHTSLDFFALADWRLSVVTPQLVSLHNAYAFLKGAVFRVLRQSALNPREVDLLSSAIDGGASEKVHSLLARLATEDQAFATALQCCLQQFSAAIIGNQIQGQGQGPLLAFARMTQDFLGLHTPVLGHIARSDRLHQSVTLRQPLLAHSISSPEAKTFFAIAERLLELDIRALRSGRHRTTQIKPQASTESRASASPYTGPLANYMRRDGRCAVQWFATLSDGRQHWPAEITNASDGGLALRCDWQPPLQSTVELQLIKPEHNSTLQGTVCRCDAQSKEVGLELARASDRAVIQGLLHEGRGSRPSERAVPMANAVQFLRS